MHNQSKNIFNDSRLNSDEASAFLKKQVIHLLSR